MKAILRGVKFLDDEQIIAPAFHLIKLVEAGYTQQGVVLDPLLKEAAKLGEMRPLRYGAGYD